MLDNLTSGCSLPGTVHHLPPHPLFSLILPHGLPWPYQHHSGPNTRFSLPWDQDAPIELSSIEDDRSVTATNEHMHMYSRIYVHLNHSPVRQCLPRTFTTRSNERARFFECVMCLHCLQRSKFLSIIECDWRRLPAVVVLSLGSLGVIRVDSGFESSRTISTLVSALYSTLRILSTTLCGLVWRPPYGILLEFLALFSYPPIEPSSRLQRSGALHE